MILITTAGKVGSEAARLLAQREEPVRVLVRDPDASAAVRPLPRPALHVLRRERGGNGQS